MKSNFEIWAHSYYDESTFPCNWKSSYGIPVLLWQIQKHGHVRFFITKDHIIQGINENMCGRLPIWHVWNLRKDCRVYCGQNQQNAYDAYRKEIIEEGGQLYDCN